MISLRPQLTRIILASQCFLKSIMRHHRCGQALVELVVFLIVLTTLIAGIATLARLCFRQEHLQRDLRLVVGESALNRGTWGFAEQPDIPESRSDPFHQINALARLEEYSPALPSLLPISQYTLRSREIADGDLGLEEKTLQETYILDEAFIQLIYGKGSVTLRESLTFPATSNIWQ